MSARVHPALELASILRLHIIGVAMAACLVFGELLTGSMRFDLALVGGVDWCLINLLNRITDLKEDLENGIVGTERVARHRRAFIVAWLVLGLGSFALTVALLPELTLLRVLVQLVGVGYSIAIVPTPSGLRRFKDIYFSKNFMSAMLFVATVFGYPLLAAGLVITHPGGLPAALLLVLFFVPFELSYEVLYDMRDLDGDRLAGVPTYPVVHGIPTSRRIVDGLLVLSALAMLAGVAGGVLGLPEALMLVALPVQRLFYAPRVARGLSRWDCIALTHLGTAQLALFLVGTRLWSLAGLPERFMLG